MSTLISFIQEEPKHILQTKAASKMSKTKKEVQIKAPSIPSNRERIINVKKYKTNIFFSIFKSFLCFAEG